MTDTIAPAAPKASWFTNFESAVAAEAKKIWAFLQPLAPKLVALAEATAEEVATIALNAVAQQAPLVLSGQVKLQNATSTVINALATQGKAVSAANAEAAVQATYNYLSAALPQAVVNK